jgi:ligand-binding sensor domain-containing protein
MRTAEIYSGSALWMGYSGLREQPKRSRSTKSDLPLVVQATKESSQLLRIGEGISGSDLPVVEDSAGTIVPTTSSLFVNDPKDPHSLSDNLFTRLYQDRSGTLWIGTWWGGLNKLDRAQKAFTYYTLKPADPKSLSHKIVTGLSEDSSGVLWVATMGGLNRFNRETKSFTQYMNDPNNPQSLGTMSVPARRQQGYDLGWDLGRGLDRLDPVKAAGQIRKEIYTLYS